MARAPIFAAPSRVEIQKVYDPDTMTWVAMTQPSGGAGGDVNVTNMIPAVETGLAKEATLQELVANRALRVDAATSTVIYVGAADPGALDSAAVWQIVKFDTTTGVVQTFADGNDNFDNVWDNRVSLSYS